jgi:leader peptidase (prepilin peptidase)/N-methyltransferase
MLIAVVVILVNLVILRRFTIFSVISNSNLFLGFGILGACLTVFTQISYYDTRFLLLLPFIFVTLVIVIIDLTSHLILNSITMGLAITQFLSFCIAFLLKIEINLAQILLSGLALFVFYFLMNLVSRNQIGMGDVKFAFTVGLTIGYIGLDWLFVSIFITFLISGIFALLLLLSKRVTRKNEIAFAPFMIIGTWTTIAIANVLKSQ